MENLKCAHCGEECKFVISKKTSPHDIVCCSQEKCALSKVVMFLHEWNRRFVCNDSNGDKVYAGDEVEYMWNSGTIKARGKVFWSDFAFWVTQEKMEYLLKDVEHITLIKKEDAK